MRRVFLGLTLAAAATLFGSQPASAAEFCVGLSNFSNVFRFEAVNFGAAIFSIVGHDRVVEERAVTGSLYLGDTFAEIGFSAYASSATGHFRSTILLTSGSGPYSLTFNGLTGVTTGTMFVISCASVPAKVEGGQSAQPQGEDWPSAAARK
jgi:hypothetical protein